MTSLVSVLPSDLARARGGAERYAIELHEALRAAQPGWRHRAIVACSAERGRHVPPGWTAVGGARARHLSAGDAIGAPTAAREVLRGADVVLLHQWRTRAAAALRVAAALRPGTTLVAMDHGAGTRYGYGLSWLPLPRAAVGAHQSRFECAISPIKARRDLVVRGGIDEARFRPDEVRSAPTTDFLMVGRFVPYKGQLRLLDGLPEGARALLVGPSDTVDPGYLDEVRRAAADRGVEIRHDLTDDELAATYRSARYTVQVPIDVRRYGGAAPPELLGLTMLEAMACGSVPICPSEGASAEFVREGVTGLTYRAEDPTALSSVLERALAAQDDDRVRDGALAEAATWTWSAAARSLLAALPPR